MSKFKLVDLIKEAMQDLQKGEYSGKGKFELPENHKAGMKVPKGGSSCSNCKFLGEDKKSCINKYWIKWNGGESKLPAPADEYCSDWFEAKEELDEMMGVSFSAMNRAGRRGHMQQQGGHHNPQAPQSPHAIK